MALAWEEKTGRDVLLFQSGYQAAEFNLRPLTNGELILEKVNFFNKVVSEQPFDEAWQQGGGKEEALSVLKSFEGKPDLSVYGYDQTGVGKMHVIEMRSPGGDKKNAYDCIVCRGDVQSIEPQKILDFVSAYKENKEQEEQKVQLGIQVADTSVFNVYPASDVEKVKECALTTAKWAQDWQGSMKPGYFRDDNDNRKTEFAGLDEIKKYFIGEMDHYGRPVPLECVKHETAQERGHLSVLEKDKMLKIGQREELGEGMIKYRYENIYSRQMFVLENLNKEKQCFDMFYINRDFQKKDAREFVKQFDSKQKLNETLARQDETIMHTDTPCVSTRR
jgi:hypothetical protein